MMRSVSFLFGLVLWSWWGWHYGWPLATLYWDVLNARNGCIGASIYASVSGFIALWGYYAAAMNLKRVIDDKRAPPVMEFLGNLLILPPGLLLDWLVNMVPCTVLFWDLPASKTELVTGRLKRYITGQRGRYRMCVAIGFALILNALDPSGKHL